MFVKTPLHCKRLKYTTKTILHLHNLSDWVATNRYKHFDIEPGYCSLFSVKLSLHIDKIDNLTALTENPSIGFR